MKEDIQRAFRVAVQQLPLILIVAVLFSAFSLKGVPGYLLAGVVVAALVLSVVLYGRLTEAVIDAEPSGWWELFRSNVLKLLVTGFLLGIPSWMTNLLVKSMDASVYASISSEYGVDALVDAITVYVLPIVFLRGLGPGAIPVGIAFLFARVRESLHLVILTLAISVGTALAALFAGTESAMLSLVIILASSFAEAIVFAAAAIKLVDVPRAEESPAMP